MLDPDAVQILKINEILLAASTPQEILMGAGLYTDSDALIGLLYVDWNSDELAAPSLSMVAAARDGQPANEAGLPHTYAADEAPGMAQFLDALAACREPVWFVEDVEQELPLAGFPFFVGVRSFAAIKLHGYRADQQYHWNAVICYTWPTRHRFTPEERFVYVMLVEPASIVVTRHQAHLETLKLVERLQEVDRIKTEFLASISHELRTPLVALNTIAEGVLRGSDGPLNDRLRRDITLIHHSGQQLLAVISDILDYSKLEAGRSLELALELFDLADLIQETITLTRCTLADGRDLTLEFKEPSSMQLTLADRNRIRQVLLNLLTNAVKFSEKGTISVEIAGEDQAVTVCVIDEGIGIALEHHALIFEPFRQVAGSPRQGTGLGLAICKRLVELHGGRIWLTSAPGQGSRFYFSLPQGKTA